MRTCRSIECSASHDNHELLAGVDAALEAESARRSRRAARLFVVASRQMALGMAAVLSRWWRRRDPVQAVFSEHLLTEIELDKQRAIAGILRARLGRFPARQRRHYAPEERFEIIRLIHTHGISHTEAGHLFVVDPNTIARWEREVFGRPDGQTVGTLVRASPPLRGYGDVIVRLVQQLDRFGIGGSATIERFWRTLKQLLASRSRPPLSVAQLEARTHLALTYYAALRPHQDLDGATPAEVYLDLPPKASRAIPPPRIHQHAIRDGPGIPLGVEYLDHERRLPVLVTRHAA